MSVKFLQEIYEGKKKQTNRPISRLTLQSLCTGAAFFSDDVPFKSDSRRSGYIAMANCCYLNILCSKLNVMRYSVEIQTPILIVIYFVFAVLAIRLAYEQSEASTPPERNLISLSAERLGHQRIRRATENQSLVCVALLVCAALLRSGAREIFDTQHSISGNRAIINAHRWKRNDRSNGPI